MDDSRRKEVEEARERLKRSLRSHLERDPNEVTTGPVTITVNDRSVLVDAENSQDYSLYQLARAWLDQGRVEVPSSSEPESHQRPPPLPLQTSEDVNMEGGPSQEESFEQMMQRWSSSRRAKCEAWRREQSRFEPRMEQLLSGREDGNVE